jgi:hypothetical protein
MQTVKIDLHSFRQKKLFFDLPFSIYKNHAQWVPPLEVDARRMLDTKKHAFYAHGEAVFFLTTDGNGQPLARLAVLNNHNYNQFNQEKTAFFYLFECIDDEEVARGLFKPAFEWVLSQKLNKITGPKGFTTLDGMGMLVKGFEHRPAFGLPYNPAYYPKLIEAVGFTRGGETVSGYLDSRMTLPSKVHEVARIVQERRGIQVVQIEDRRGLKKIIPQLNTMYNQALAETTGNIPLTEDDVNTMANQMLWFADPKLIKIIMKDDCPIGFLLAYPDVSAAVQRCRGRLFPFGWIDLLIEKKRTQWININGVALVEKYRGLGGTALLFSEMYKSVLDSQYKYADLVQVGVENERMLLELRNLGIEFYKKHMIYDYYL